MPQDAARHAPGLRARRARLAPDRHIHRVRLIVELNELEHICAAHVVQRTARPLERRPCCVVEVSAMPSDDAAGPRSGQHERVEDTRAPVDQLSDRLDVLREIYRGAFDKVPPEGRLRVVEVVEINVWQLVQEGQLPAKERQAECACESLELRHVHNVPLVPRDHLETTEGHGRSRQ